MRATLYFFSTAAILGLASCNSEPAVDETPAVDAVEICNYSYNEGTTTFEWTAFKTSDKVGVPGGFNEITVSSESSDNPKDVLESITFSMNTASVETNNEDRNGKIAEHFFQTINTDAIEGGIKSIGDDGKAVIEVTMNGITMDVEGDYTLEDRDFSFNATIDVSGWDALTGIEALNTVCKDLHTGADGVSKLWSEVALSFTTKLKSDCD